MNQFFNIFIVLVVAFNLATAVDYCGTSLCSAGNHVACGNNGQFVSTCPSDATLVNLSATQKALLVNAHNEKRNLIAGGGDSKHSRACRMATMQWDDELAALAELNVKQCAMKHDKCRNTAAFKYSGQNLAWSGYFDPLNVDSELQKSVNMWYGEVKDSKQQYVDKYPNNYNGPAIGHFTVMMADKNIRVGCASSHYSVSGQSYRALLVACNYATTNMIDHPIYKSCSSAASGCTTGTNPSFTNLCSVSENYDVNKWF